MYMIGNEIHQDRSKRYTGQDLKNQQYSYKHYCWLSPHIFPKSLVTPQLLPHNSSRTLPTFNFSATWILLSHGNYTVLRSDTSEVICLRTCPHAYTVSIFIKQSHLPRELDITPSTCGPQKRSKDLPSNYRSISPLSIVSKLMDSVISSQVLIYLEN